MIEQQLLGRAGTYQLPLKDLNACVVPKLILIRCIAMQTFILFQCVVFLAAGEPRCCYREDVKSTSLLAASRKATGRGARTGSYLLNVARREKLTTKPSA